MMPLGIGSLPGTRVPGLLRCAKGIEHDPSLMIFVELRQGSVIETEVAKGRVRTNGIIEPE